jgi:septal ring factor EnvC (AmiA/AmiB activator)
VNRAKSSRLVDSAMYEQDRSAALGEQALDIIELMGKLSDQAELRERLSQLPGPIPRPLVPGMAPEPRVVAEAQSEERPGYRLPVVGRVVTGLGEVSESGIRARGLTIATVPGALVVAPTSGRIAYAGQFRGYGRIVILDHGNGWTTLLTGLGTTKIAVGDEVAQGAPIGTVSGRRPSLTVELRRNGQPVDITSMIGAV